MSISLLLDSLLSYFVPIGVFNNIFIVPMFTIISLIIIYPYCEERKDFFKICLLFGFIYDILFTNVFGLNITIFFIIGYVISFMDGILSNTLFSIIIKMIIVILLYDTLTYFILVILNYMNYDIFALFKKLYKSILINIIYITTLYFTTNELAKRFSIRKAN